MGRFFFLVWGYVDFKCFLELQEYEEFPSHLDLLKLPIAYDTCITKRSATKLQYYLLYINSASTFVEMPGADVRCVKEGILSGDIVVVIFTLRIFIISCSFTISVCSYCDYTL